MKNDYIKHHGVKGMKWGVRRFQPYPKGKGHKGKFKPNKKPKTRAGSIRGAMARRSNRKVDKGFENWRVNAKKREDAIAKGKTATAAERSYRKGEASKQDYKSAKKDYKKALKSNTTYRKGQVRQQVGQDRARKLLSDAKKLQKQLDNDPGNRQLAKQVRKTMDEYNVARSKARKAPDVAAKRSQIKANIKRGLTTTVKAATATAAISAGGYAVNEYLKKNGHQGLTMDQVKQYANMGMDLLEKGSKVNSLLY